MALASVTLPDTLFPPDTPADCKLQFVAFRTGSFFPLSGNSSNTGEHARRRSVNTPVLFVGLGEEPLLCIFLATFNFFSITSDFFMYFQQCAVATVIFADFLLLHHTVFFQ